VNLLLSLLFLTSAHDGCLPFGRFTLDKAADYSCVSGLATWSVDSVVILDAGEPNLTATASPGPLPGLAGAVACGSHTFSLSGVATGQCNETWTLAGTIDLEGNWTGTLDVVFVPSTPGLCFDCLDTQWDVSGTFVPAPTEKSSWAAVKTRY